MEYQNWVYWVPAVPTIETVGCDKTQISLARYDHYGWVENTVIKLGRVSCHGMVGLVQLSQASQIWCVGSGFCDQMGQHSRLLVKVVVLNPDYHWLVFDQIALHVHSDTTNTAWLYNLMC